MKKYVLQLDLGLQIILVPSGFCYSLRLQGMYLERETKMALPFWAQLTSRFFFKSHGNAGAVPMNTDIFMEKRRAGGELACGAGKLDSAVNNGVPRGRAKEADERDGGGHGSAGQSLQVEKGPPAAELQQSAESARADVFSDLDEQDMQRRRRAWDKGGAGSHKMRPA